MKFQQPSPAIRPLKRLIQIRTKKRQFLRHFFRRKLPVKQSNRLGTQLRIRKFLDRLRQQPMPMNGRMPIKTPVKNRMQLTRRFQIRITRQHLPQFIWIFRLNTRQRKLRKFIHQRILQLQIRIRHLPKSR